VELVDFFVAEPQKGQTQETKTRSKPRLVVIDGKARHRVIVSRCIKALARIPADGYVAVVIDLGEAGYLQRLANFLSLRFHLLRAERALARCGAVRTEVFGVSPDLASPTIICPLAGAAARYAQNNLLPAGRFIPLRSALAWWARCDVSLGAVLVIGRKS